jgi:hypothetical protein
MAASVHALPTRKPFRLRWPRPGCGWRRPAATPALLLLLLLLLLLASVLLLLLLLLLPAAAPAAASAARLLPSTMASARPGTAHAVLCVVCGAWCVLCGGGASCVSVWWALLWYF